MWGLNVTYSQASGNLFPSQKLKDSHTFTTQLASMEGNRAAEDSGMKADKAEEAESSDGEDPETSSGVGGADQLVGYIIHFTNAVKLYQRKNQNCFRCGSPHHLVKDCLKDLSKTTKSEFKHKGRDDEEGRPDPSETSSCSMGVSR